MSRTPATRRVLLYGSLCVTVAATVWTARHRAATNDEASVVLPVTSVRSAGGRPLPQLPPPPSPAGADMQRLAVTDVTTSKATHLDIDPFAVRSWQPAPPPPPPPPPPAPMPEPMAPPLPFAYVGRQEQPGTGKPTTYYLTRGADFFAVVAGDAMGGEYRFDGYEQGVLRFTYLPLTVQQQMILGMTP